ncbi:metallophosphoesterase family protein [Vallitalea okinawensis]|uniref:metallophosphoesterase family protein n=1 Tax=Vallitalea okinawensis TaxID=2078660 RepID=UPI000CFBED4A|nr:metallophosphoesterase [Vallitalea okinawensis]
MKILTVSDHESKYIWDYFDRERFKDIDLVISCGDLKPKYLSFLVTMIHVPLIYVHGNHDDRYERTPPEGCMSIEDQLYIHNGVRILGLGGSYRYNDGKNQYTEDAMLRRVKKLRKQLRKHNGFDILVTHSPAYGLGDGEDLPHRGFNCFNDLLDQYKPSYYIHGHQHLNYNRQQKRITQHNETTIVNAYEYYIFNYMHNRYAYDAKKNRKGYLASLRGNDFY